MSVPITVAAPRRPFISRKPMIRQSALALVRALVGRAHFYLHDHELSRSPPDESFIGLLKQNCCLSGPHFRPPAIVEVLQNYVTNYHKVRRLQSGKSSSSFKPKSARA